MTPTPRATSRRCRARAIDSSRRSPRPPGPPLSAALADPAAADSRWPDIRPARLGPARALQATGLGFRQHPRRHRAGDRRLAHAGQAVSVRGHPAECAAHGGGAAAGRHVHRAERAGAVRRAHRGTVELAGAHSDAARGGAHLGVRLQGQEHRRARHRAAARSHARARGLAAPLGRPAAHHHAAHRGRQRPARLVEVLRSADRRHLPDRRHGVALGGRGAAPATFRGHGRTMGTAPAGQDGGLRAVLVRQGAPAQAHRRGQSQGRGIPAARAWTPIRNSRWRTWRWRKRC